MANINFNKSQEAIAELTAKRPLTRRMLMVSAAKLLAEQLPIEDSIAIANAGPAEFVQTARQPLRAVGLALGDDDLREVFGMMCPLLSARARREGKVPTRRLVN